MYNTPVQLYVYGYGTVPVHILYTVRLTNYAVDLWLPTHYKEGGKSLVELHWFMSQSQNSAFWLDDQSEVRIQYSLANGMISWMDFTLRRSAFWQPWRRSESLRMDSELTHQQIGNSGWCEMNNSVMHEVPRVWIDPVLRSDWQQGRIARSLAAGGIGWEKSTRDCHLSDSETIPTRYGTAVEDLILRSSEL